MDQKKQDVSQSGVHHQRLPYASEPFLGNSSVDSLTGEHGASRQLSQQPYQNIMPPQEGNIGHINNGNQDIGQPQILRDVPERPINKSPKKRTSLWLGLGLITALIAFAAIAIFIVVRDKAGQENSHFDQNSPKEDVSTLLKTYTKSTATDNIALPFNATSNGYYVIDFKGEGIGERLTIDGNTLSNGNIDISHYYRTQFVDGSAIFDNLWGFKNVTVKTGDSKIPTSGSFQDYEIVANDQNCYLVRSIWHESREEAYSIYIGNTEQDYFFKITSADMYSLEDTYKLYQKVIDDATISYVNYDENDNFLESTRSIDDATPIDVSNWRFLPDMIMEYYADCGLTYVDSIHTEAFNYYNRLETTIYLPNKEKDKVKLEQITINLMDESSYNKIVAKYEEGSTDKELIDLNAFESAYLYNTSNTANFNVKTNKANYYNITTDLPYYKSNDNAENQKNSAINFMNQIFLK